MARLRQISAAAQEVILALKCDEVVIGRAEDCDICALEFADVSRQHCGLKHYEDGVWTVTDFGSRNGTFVNNEQIFSETTLQHGDRIKLCERLEFIFENPPDSPPPSLTRPSGNTEFIRALDEIEHELEERDYRAVMQDLVEQARPRPRAPKPDADG